MSIASLLAAIALHVPLPTGTQIITAPCPVVGIAHNCATPDGTIYFADRLNGSTETKLGLAHELGHEWDYQHLSDADRLHYAQVIGSREPWFTTSTVIPSAPHLPLAERFADTYALCAMGSRWRDNFRSWWGPLRGDYGERIGRRDLALTCWWLRHPPTTSQTSTDPEP